MKIVGFTAEFKEFAGNYVNVGVHREGCTTDTLLLLYAFEAILKCMKDTNRKAFYLAMTRFVDDSEFDDACKFLEDAENE